jgi:hypothetical protein
MEQILFVQLPPPRFSFSEAPTNIPLASGFVAAALDATTKLRLSSEVLEPQITDVFPDHRVSILLRPIRTSPIAIFLT